MKKLSSSRHSRGFSLVELLVVVTAIGALAGMAYHAMTGMHATAKNQKLEQDVATINRAVQLYRTFGGNLTGVTDANVVLSKLKSRADAASAGKILGLRENFLDPRVVPVWQTAQEASTSMPRARWDGNQFVIATSGTAGIKEFAFDEAAAASVQTESRSPFVKEASSSGWIWVHGSATLASSYAAGVEPSLGATPGMLDFEVPTGLRGVFTVGGSGQVHVGYAFREAGYNGRLALVSLEGMENFDLSSNAGRHAFLMELVRRVVENDRAQVIIDASQQSSGSGTNTFYFRPGDKLAPVLIPNGSFQDAYAFMQNGWYWDQLYPLTSLNLGTNQPPFYANQMASLGNGGYAIEDIAGGGDADYDDMVFRLDGLIQDDSQQFLQIDPATYYPQRLAQLGRNYWNNPYNGGPSLQQALINAGILP